MKIQETAKEILRKPIVEAEVLLSRIRTAAGDEIADAIIAQFSKAINEILNNKG